MQDVIRFPRSWIDSHRSRSSTGVRGQRNWFDVQFSVLVRLFFFLSKGSSSATFPLGLASRFPRFPPRGKRFWNQPVTRPFRSRKLHVTIVLCVAPTKWHWTNCWSRGLEHPFDLYAYVQTVCNTAWNIVQWYAPDTMAFCATIRFLWFPPFSSP